MKNKYRKLKAKLLFQTILWAVVAVIIAVIVLYFFIDGIFQGAFAKGFIGLLVKLNIEYDTADKIYGVIFMDNKNAFIVVGSMALLLIFVYISIGRLAKYLDQIGEGIENILSDSMEPIDLMDGLEPISEKLNSIKLELRKRQSEAEETEQRKNDLVVFLAHDLKTPLTSIIAYLSILDEQPDIPVEERKKFTHVSLEKAIRLGELVNEFFEITTLNLQDIVLEKGRLNISMMLEQLADEFYAVLNEKKLTCSVETDDDLVVDGDPDKLARVFDNLLRNAIAYSYSNTNIDIAAKGKKSVIEITFTNQGNQIPTQKLSVIFEKFYRVDNARSSQTGGAGLGLAIAKEIVELHEGSIEAYSDELSTRFIVRLPRAKKVDEKVKKIKLRQTMELPKIIINKSRDSEKGE